MIVFEDAFGCVCGYKISILVLCSACGEVKGVEERENESRGSDDGEGDDGDKERGWEGRLEEGIKLGEGDTGGCDVFEVLEFEDVVTRRICGEGR